MRRGLGSEHGMALLVAIVITAVLVSLTGAGLLLNGLNLKTAGSLNAGNGAFQAADAGVQHALALIPSGVDFDALLAGSVTGLPCAPSSPCDGTINKATLSGSLSDYNYAVVAEDDADGGSGIDDMNNFILLTSTATGPNGAKRKIKAYVARSTWVPPGALYIPGQPEFIEAAFNGNSFQVNGNDTNPDALPGSGPARPIPGIATTVAGTTNEISAGLLSSTHYPQVTGVGTTPSVRTSPAVINVSQLADNLISAGVEGSDKQTLGGGSYADTQWGSSTQPKITHITGDAQLSGALSGWGLLVVDGNLSTQGNLSFYGLVIVRGHANIHGAAGASEYATIWGAVFIQESVAQDAGAEFEIGGQGKVYFSSETISQVATTWSAPFSGLPKPAKFVGWQEVME